MNLDNLLQNPEHYRIGDNYRATGIVFPVKYDRLTFIVKKNRHRALSVIVESYYVFQDCFFLRTRRYATARDKLAREAQILNQLSGLHAPRLVAYDGRTLVREFLEGTFISKIADDQKLSSLEMALKAMQDFHNRGVTIGDAHVKNILVQEHNAYWLDFGALISEEDLEKAKAVDILKFIYSTYTVTKNQDLTAFIAHKAAEIYNSTVQLDQAKKIAELLSRKNRVALWFPTRVPVNGNLPSKIFEELSL